MNYKLLNEKLKDLVEFRNKNKPLEKMVVHEISDPEGSQGESNEIYEVYKSPIEGVFIKLKISSDSYGDNEFVSGIQFVSPVQKTVTSYEPLN